MFQRQGLTFYDFIKVHDLETRFIDKANSTVFFEDRARTDWLFFGSRAEFEAAKRLPAKMRSTRVLALVDDGEAGLFDGLKHVFTARSFFKLLMCLDEDHSCIPYIAEVRH